MQVSGPNDAPEHEDETKVGAKDLNDPPDRCVGHDQRGVIALEEKVVEI